MVAVLQRCNQVSEWVATEILLADSNTARVALLQHFLSLAEVGRKEREREKKKKKKRKKK